MIKKCSIFFIVLLLMSLIGCSSTTTSYSFNIVPVTGNDITLIADTNSKYEYTMICTYQMYCPFCVEEFPKIYSYIKELPINFYILLTCREKDSSYIYSSMKQVWNTDSKFCHFLILSDSMYNKESQNNEQNGIFKHYGGSKEGNKYINYVDSFIPEGFNHDCFTPKLILYKKNQGIVYVNTYNDTLESCFSALDRDTLNSILINKNKQNE